MTGDVSDTSVTTHDATFAQTTFGAQRARELGALLPALSLLLLSLLLPVSAGAADHWCWCWHAVSDGPTATDRAQAEVTSPGVSNVGLSSGVNTLDGPRTHAWHLVAGRPSGTQ